MSWQSYVDDQLLATKTVTAAAIAGHDGNLWATSTGFPATTEEVRKVLGSMGDTQGLAMAGVTVGGVRYMYLSGDDKVIRARKKTSGLHVMKTVQAVIIAVYDEPIVPEQCANTTEKLGDYLISVGY
jgi:profilin